VILSVGRLHPQKNYSGLIEAFATVRTEVDARLMILGEGESRAELEQRSEELDLADEVALPGSTENPYAYMRRASVLVVSSFTEALPSALIEAMACDCPVVSTNCSSGPVEILQDGEYGRLVPVNDPDALAEGIVSTLRDPPPPSKLEDRAMDFSAETITDEYERTLFPE
jgi:glycosyltransferase involved in cell wall biosynthesis